MEFRFPCLVTRHASGRVTVTPIDDPDLGVHAATLEQAIEDLTLAFDDRISRAHPRRVAEFCHDDLLELAKVNTDSVAVWGETETANVTLRSTALIADAMKGYSDVRVPRADVRWWIAGKKILPEAEQRLAEHLQTLSERERLNLRPEGDESLFVLPVKAQPAPLASFKPSQLFLDEKPPPAPPDDEPVEPDEDDGWEPDRRAKKPKPAETKPSTATLDRIGVRWDLAARECQLDGAFEQEELVNALLARIGSDEPDPIVLVAPSGAGKTAVLQQAAIQLAAETDKARRDRPFVHLDAPRLIAGEGFMGDWQRQVLACLEEARRAKAILHLGHLISLLDAGKSAQSDQNVAQLLLPELRMREIAFVGEATPEELAVLEQRNQSFARAFFPLRLEEPRADRLQRIVQRSAAELSKQHDLEIANDAIDGLIALSRRFRPYGALVGNAVTQLRRTVQARAHAKAKTLSRLDAIDFFSSESGIPAVFLRDDLRLEPDDVRAFLSRRVMGQPAAVDRVVAVVATIKAGLADARRPTATLLFAGPTGVGKTELSKALAEQVFGSPERLVRIDLGEYTGPGALVRLIGERGAPGLLTSAVRRQPFSVVLLDEIEKAHPSVFDALLGVLGEGRLTDADGRLTDFRSTVIVMTTNLGAETLRSAVGFSEGRNAGDLQRHYLAEAQRFFRPELFNRIDEVIVFHPLGQPEIERIVHRELDAIRSRSGLAQQQATLEVSSQAIQQLARRGFDPRYGARPLKRALERELVVPVAAHLAEHGAAGARRLTMNASADGALSLSAENLASNEDGSVGAIAELLDRARDLRAEARRWFSSPAMRRLRESTEWFDKASRTPAFWADRALAEGSAQRASEGRSLDTELAALAKQVEAAEDLLFEAYHLRQAGQAPAVGSELELLRARLQPLKTRVFASLVPVRAAVTLNIVPARGAWHWALWLLAAYEQWAQRNDAKVRTYVAMHVQVDCIPPEKRRDPNAQWEWKARQPNADDTPMPAAICVELAGGPSLALLTAEHGLHRFYDQGSSTSVKVMFMPTKVAPLPDVPKLEDAMPNIEIRRIWAERKGHPTGVLKDLRTNTEHEADRVGFTLSDVLGAYAEWRVFGSEDE